MGTSGSPRWIFTVVVGAVVVVAGAIVVDAGAGAVVVGAAVPIATSYTCASTSLSRVIDEIPNSCDRLGSRGGPAGERRIGSDPVSLVTSVVLGSTMKSLDCSVENVADDEHELGVSGRAGEVGSSMVLFALVKVA